MLRALKLPGVRWILGLHAADLVLEYASSVALMVLVYDATNSPLAAAAMLFAKQVVPGALLVWLGRLLEHIEPRRGLAVAYAIRAGSLAALAVAWSSPALYPLAFAAGLAGTSSRVLIRTLAVRSTTGEMFRALTALQNVVFAVIALIGPAFGAAAASWMPPETSMLVWVALATLLVGTSLAMPRAQEAIRAEGEAEESARPVADPAGQTSVRALLALGAVLALVFSMDEPALLAYVREDLRGDVGMYGVILVTWGSGMVAGGLVYSRFGIARPSAAIVLGVVAAALGYVGLGLAPTVGVACVAAVIGGAGNGSYWVALVTAVLEQAPAGTEARASGQLEGVITAMPALGIAAGGALAEFVEPRVTLWLPGVAALLALATWLVTAHASRTGRSASGQPAPESAVVAPLAHAPLPAASAAHPQAKALA